MDTKQCAQLPDLDLKERLSRGSKKSSFVVW